MFEIGLVDCKIMRFTIMICPLKHIKLLEGRVWEPTLLVPRILERIPEANASIPRQTILLLNTEDI